MSTRVASTKKRVPRVNLLIDDPVLDGYMVLATSVASPSFKDLAYPSSSIFLSRSLSADRLQLDIEPIVPALPTEPPIPPSIKQCPRPKK